MKLNIDPSWLRRAAEKEDGCIISVGGLVVKLTAINPSLSPRQPHPDQPPPALSNPDK
jgi:hypothetical protein